METEIENGYYIVTDKLPVPFDPIPEAEEGMDILRYETMVFREGDTRALDCARYSSYLKARRGHRNMVREWKEEISKN